MQGSNLHLLLILISKQSLDFWLLVWQNKCHWDTAVAIYWLNNTKIDRSINNDNCWLKSYLCLTFWHTVKISAVFFTRFTKKWRKFRRCDWSVCKAKSIPIQGFKFKTYSSNMFGEMLCSVLLSLCWFLWKNIFINYMYHTVYGTKVHRFKAVWNYVSLIKTRAKAVRQLILMFAVQMLVLKLGTWGNSIWNL